MMIVKVAMMIIILLDIITTCNKDTKGWYPEMINMIMTITNVIVMVIMMIAKMVMMIVSTLWQHAAVNDKDD